MEGHRDRIREEIISYLGSRSANLANYVQAETETVLNGLYNDSESDIHPDNLDPETEEGDYYRESIAEYGTVFEEYPPEDDD